MANGSRNLKDQGARTTDLGPGVKDFGPRIKDHGRAPRLKRGEDQSPRTKDWISRIKGPGPRTKERVSDELHWIFANNNKSHPQAPLELERIREGSHRMVWPNRNLSKIF